jgi:hypothetical protein
MEYIDMEYFELVSLAIVANPWIVPLLIWSLICKGFALWRAAMNKSKTWFVVLLIVNTFGILDLIYFFLLSEKKKK